MGVRMAFSARTAEAIWKTYISVFKQYSLNPALHQCTEASVSSPVGTLFLYNNVSPI